MRNAFLESGDVPTYFHCKYVPLPLPPTTRPPRSLSPILRGADSSDAPFIMPYVPVLDPVTRNSEYEKRSKSPGRFTNQLKMLTPTPHPAFTYEDHSSVSPDLASIRPSQVLDAVADSGLRLRSKSPFARKYQKQLQTCGFGAQRGVFTVLANTPKIERTTQVRLDALKTSSLRSRRRETPVKSRVSITPPRCSPGKSLVTQEEEDSVTTQVAVFEEKLSVERTHRSNRRQGYFR